MLYIVLEITGANVEAIVLCNMYLFFTSFSFFVFSLPA